MAYRVSSRTHVCVLLVENIWGWQVDPHRRDDPDPVRVAGEKQGETCD